jgi:hypothetical protein
MMNWAADMGLAVFSSVGTRVCGVPATRGNNPHVLNIFPGIKPQSIHGAAPSRFDDI